jgi:hypothetical protein
MPAVCWSLQNADAFIMLESAECNDAIIMPEPAEC